MQRKDAFEKVLAQENPLVVGAVSRRDFLKNPAAEYANCCDLVELRLDELGFDEVVQAFAANCPLPLLITARGPAEGGANAMNLDARANAYRTLMPYASLIDVELSSFSELAGVLNEARQKKVTIVGSFHNFEETPSLIELQSKNLEASDIFKVATLTRSRAELDILADLLEATLPDPTSVMGMGTLGSAARPLLARLGSVLNYGYLGSHATAPGQWPARRLKECLS